MGLIVLDLVALAGGFGSMRSHTYGGVAANITGTEDLMKQKDHGSIKYNTDVSSISLSLSFRYSSNIVSFIVFSTTTIKLFCLFSTFLFAFFWFPYIT